MPDPLGRRALAESIGTGFLVAAVIGSGIAAASFFTSSTSFANPAVTLGRTLSNTFAGISPSSVPAFIAFQFVGAAIAWGAIRVLFPDVRATAAWVVVPHGRDAEARMDGGARP